MYALAHKIPDIIAARRIFGDEIESPSLDPLAGLDAGILPIVDVFPVLVIPTLDPLAGFFTVPPLSGADNAVDAPDCPHIKFVDVQGVPRTRFYVYNGSSYPLRFAPGGNLATYMASVNSMGQGATVLWMPAQRCEFVRTPDDRWLPVCPDNYSLAISSPLDPNTWGGVINFTPSGTTTMVSENAVFTTQPHTSAGDALIMVTYTISFNGAFSIPGGADANIGWPWIVGGRSTYTLPWVHVPLYNVRVHEQVASQRYFFICTDATGNMFIRVTPATNNADARGTCVLGVPISIVCASTLI